MPYLITVPLADGKLGYIGFRPCEGGTIYFITNKPSCTIAFETEKEANDFIIKAADRLPLTGAIINYVKQGEKSELDKIIR